MDKQRKEKRMIIQMQESHELPSTTIIIRFASGVPCGKICTVYKGAVILKNKK